MSFRGINTTVIQIRRAVFTEVARMAYANKSPGWPTPTSRAKRQTT